MANWRLLVLVVFLSILTVSCATPPGKLTEADFISKEIFLDIPVTKAYRQLREGFRYCGPESGGIFFGKVHGVPECMPVEEDGSVLCDLYGLSPWGGHTGIAFGRIELKPHKEGTLAIFRVVNEVNAKKREVITESWEQFVRGRAKEACPE